MKSRRGFFSALAGAITGGAASAATDVENSQRFTLQTSVECNCGSVMLPEVRDGKHAFRCVSEDCPNYGKLFQRPTMELLQVGQVSARKLDREAREWKEKHDKCREELRQEQAQWLAQFKTPMVYAKLSDGKRTNA
jgi:hypothetical protein